jgi:hypothetical protein
MDKEVKAAIDYLIKEWVDFTPDEFDWDGKAETITFSLPFSQQKYTLDRASFLDFAQDCQHAKIDESESVIHTKRRTILLVHPVSLKAQYIAFYKGKALNFKVNDTVSLHFHPVHPIVGFIGLQQDAFNEHLAPDMYPCVEILYASGSQKLSEEDEQKLLESFLFELAATADLIFSKASLQQDTENPFEELEEQEQEYAPKLRPVETFNEGMRLFNAAIQVNDAELRLLSLFKVLEYFGPIVTALDSNEALRKKLDSPSALTPDANYLQSVFELTRSLEKRRNDNEMIRLLLDKCADMIELSKKLPRPRFRQLNYEDKKSEIEAQTKAVADALVATRNQVAHAKSDYKPVGNEVPRKELSQFNAFIEAAAVQAIRWYNRLPAHLKLTL